jgi:pimeloyl-ACP methyl ester carboxylesterase
MKTIEHTIPTMSGRLISVVESGKPDGIPVLVFHGTPGSRLLYQDWIEDAQRRGIRLISYDRPGYGGSTPQEGRSVGSAAGDVAAIAEALALERLLLWGASGGGPHVLACAALLPDLVAAAAVLACAAPYPSKGLDWLAGMGQDNIMEFNAAIQSRELIQQFTEKEAGNMLKMDADLLVQMYRSILSPLDVAVFSDEYGHFVLNRVRDGIRERRDGWVDDDIAFTTPWGFDLDKIRIPVLLLHGEQDQAVPVAHGKWLAGKIPGVDARFFPNDGHLTVVMRSIPDVHAWLLSKM